MARLILSNMALKRPKMPRKILAIVELLIPSANSLMVVSKIKLLYSGTSIQETPSGPS